MKLKSWILVLTLALTTTVSAATNDLTSLLQKGLFEEEANRDLTAAIANYQSLASAFDKDRQLAATAIFRLGECYRKLGKTNEAVVQYQRIIKEFGDQQTLATLSRQNLAGLNVAPVSQASSSSGYAVIEEEANAASLQAQLDGIAKLSQNQARIYVQQNFSNPVLTMLMQELDLAQQSVVKLKLDYTPDHPKYKNAEEMVKDLNTRIDSQVEGILQGLRGKLAQSQVKLGILQQREKESAAASSGGSESPAAQQSLVTDEEQQEIRRIQLMIQNSPDLINAPSAYDGHLKTPLQVAAEKGQLVVAKYLLDHGASVDEKAGAGAPPLSRAADNGHKAMVELLLDRGAEPNSASGPNPLYQAISRGFPGVMDTLLAHKADPNAKTGDNGKRPLHAAASKGSTNSIQTLIEHGADVNARDSSSDTPLHLAVGQNWPDAARLLLSAKAEVNAKNWQANTPLHEAVNLRNANAAMVSLLLDSGAAVDATNILNATPLTLAVYRNSADATRVLLEHKADPNHIGKFQESGSSNPETIVPVITAIRPANLEILKLLLNAGADSETGGLYGSPLFIAIDRNNTEAVRLLLEHGANPNRVQNGVPAVNKVLIDRRDDRMVSLLLDKGADANSRDADVFTPLFRTQDADTARALISHKADVNARGKSGVTPLMNVWNTNCLKVLLENGANPDLQDTNGNTALHSAVYYSLTTTVTALLEAKANPNIQNNRGYTPLDMAEAGKKGQDLLAIMVPGVSGSSPPPIAAQTEIAGILIKAGGLVNLPKRDRIEVRRASASFFTISKDSQGRNQMSLLETIATAYGLLGQKASGAWPATTDTRQSSFNLNLRFPDFKRVIIYRRTADSTKQTAINVDVESILNTVDCSRNVWLEWGDIVEIPEADHPVDEQWPGFSDPDTTAMSKCLARKVTVVIKGESTGLMLTPAFMPATKSPGNPLRTLVHASFMLRAVLDNSKLVRVSSDLAHVKVTRTDPATKKTSEWIIDCTDNNQSSLWLRDGDVIEVPEK